MPLLESDKRLLEELQRDLPLETCPFAALGRRCGMEEAELLDRVRKLLEEGIIRELSVILDGHRLGYRSTLVAVRVPEELIEEAAARISSHPGVSHNYQRNHEYGIWFTLSIPKHRNFEAEIEGLLAGTNEASYLLLPAVRTYKLGVHLRLTKHESETESHMLKAGIAPTDCESGVDADPGRADTVSATTKQVYLDALDRRIISVLQEHFPLDPQPWRTIAERLGTEEDELLVRVEALKSRGVIRRIAAVLRHRKAGFTANGMACFAVPDEGVDRAGREIAQFPQVSHCYQRKTYPEWRYPLFAMVHARTREKCSKIVEEIAHQIGCKDYRTLYSIREFKKERTKYVEVEVE
jgi:DNA-binding Lrp family transcriptional regulator